MLVLGVSFELKLGHVLAVERSRFPCTRCGLAQEDERAIEVARHGEIVVCFAAEVDQGMLGLVEAGESGAPKLLYILPLDRQVAERVQLVLSVASQDADTVAQ
jgi:hypothetical protein